ncbi:MAG: DNA-binding response regulator, partial [Sphingobacteriales bacterium]
MLNLIAIDDEPYALKVLIDHCSKIDFVTLQNTFTNPIEGLNFMRSNSVTVVLLDIKMHDI